MQILNPRCSHWPGFFDKGENLCLYHEISLIKIPEMWWASKPPSVGVYVIFSPISSFIQAVGRHHHSHTPTWELVSPAELTREESVPLLFPFSQSFFLPGLRCGIALLVLLDMRMCLLYALTEVGAIRGIN